MNIVDSVGRLFGGDGDIAKERDPIFFLREWVCWDLFQVVPACEVLQGCGRSVLMKRVIVDSLLHQPQIRFTWVKNALSAGVPQAVNPIVSMNTVRRVNSQ